MSLNLEVISSEPASNPKPTPVLFVHGMFQGAWAWAENFLPYFSQHGYATYALSLRGHGKSECKGDIRWVRLRDYVEDVAQVAKSFQTAPILVGHSMGGMIVQKYLETHLSPAAILLASAPPSGLLPSTLSLAKRHPDVFLKIMLKLSPGSMVGTPALYKETFFSDTLPEDRLMEYFGRLNEESLRVTLDMMGLDLPHPKRIKAPMLVIGAAHDRSVLPKEFGRTAKYYHTQPVMFNMNHNMMLEDGWQMVANCIMDWLKERNL
jgi:pimeloyl-ACP methyl ester carboxylesterase